MENCSEAIVHWDRAYEDMSWIHTFSKDSVRQVALFESTINWPYPSAMGYAWHLVLRASPEENFWR
jgi:hypothetical protein